MISLAFWLSVVFILYTYIGYPLLIGFLAMLKYRVVKSPKDFEPSVTLLITAYNEESVIEKKIVNSLDLDYPREKLQILIAADGSSDSTPEIVGKYVDQNVELNYAVERKGKIDAMNRAVTRATGDVIVFSDANNLYEIDAIRRLVAPFSESSVGATTGSKIIIRNGSDLGAAEGTYWKYESWIKKNETTFSSSIGAVGEIFAVRRELYVPPPASVINDDFFIVLDLLNRGYRIYYVSGARSFEYASVRESDEITRRARMTTGKYQAMFSFFNLLPFDRPILIWQIISHKYFRAILPFGFIGAFLANILAILFPARLAMPSIIALTDPYNMLLMALQVVFYGVAYLGNRKGFGGMMGKFFYIPTYLVNSNIAVLKGLYGFLTKTQTNIWERVQRENF